MDMRDFYMSTASFTMSEIHKLFHFQVTYRNRSFSQGILYLQALI